MKIIIPDRLREKLKQQEEWNASITNLISNTENYISLSPKFFPDYTIHGVEHVNKVINMANCLITDETLRKLSSRDISVLISAILLHDIGMFITEDGLFKILFGEDSTSKIEYLDKDIWREEWDSYLQKIKLYSDYELFNVFAEFDPIEDPPRDINKLKRKDFLIYGEFIRRQHPRLAHHIAIKSFPGSRSRDIFENVGALRECRDLVGLIARSHGMDIRDTEKYIAKNYADSTRPNNIPVFFLMTVLRLADYLDAGKHRAPVELEERQEIPVRISKKEWKWNQCIDVQNYSWTQSKSVLAIQANPSNTSEFIKIEHWLNDIQHEIDLSWAIIAEKYTVNEYNLSIHRIQSNILNRQSREEFSTKFITKEAKLVANADLLKLLIQPLYGNDPSYGVREMLQNSVDACIERQNYEEKRGNIQYTPKVEILIDTKFKTFIIKDNGIGMNENILLNYYLSAGSSYRFSKDWIMEFTSNTDEEIIRTGKFGVGVLSSFLLGTSIFVQTRRVNDNTGFEFEFQMNPSLINIKRKDCEIGTTIKIIINDNVLELLEYPINHHSSIIRWYEWYAFKSPLVKYYVDGKECFKIHKFIPNNNENIKGWYSFNSKYYKSFQWQYRSEKEFYCNGIRIPEIKQYHIGENAGLSMMVPNFSIVDPKCNLRIDLARSSVLEFPDESGFIKEAYKYFLAKLLTCNITAKDYNHYGFYEAFSYGIDSYSKSFFSDFLITNKGYTLCSAPFILAAKIDHLLLCAFHPDKDIRQLTEQIKKAPPIVLSAIRKERASIDYYKNIINKNFIINLTRHTNYKINGALLHLWVEKEPFDAIKDKLPKYFYRTTKYNLSHPAYYQYDNIQCGSPITEINLNPKVFPIIADYSIEVKYDLKNNIMLETIKQYLGEDIWIPYDLESRKKKFPRAFQELRYYMDLL